MASQGLQAQQKAYPIEIRDLTDLMQVQLKPDEQQDYLNKHGQVAGLMKKLKTNPQTGLSTDNKQDLLNRATQFGKNEIPAKPPKSFFFLMWEAGQDTTLIILICSAAISLILSFFHIEDKRDIGEEVLKISKFLLLTGKIKIKKRSLIFYKLLLKKDGLPLLEGFSFAKKFRIILLREYEMPFLRCIFNFTIKIETSLNERIVT